MQFHVPENKILRQVLTVIFPFKEYHNDICFHYVIRNSLLVSHFLVRREKLKASHLVQILHPITTSHLVELRFSPRNNAAKRNKLSRFIHFFFVGGNILTIEKMLICDKILFLTMLICDKILFSANIRHF